MIDEKELMNALGVDETESAEGEKDRKAAETGGNSSDQKTQTAEERHKYASARRKAEAEKEKAIADVKAAAEAEKEKAVKAAKDDVYAQMGLTNPYTGKKITSEADYLDYKADHADKLRKKAAEKMGIPPGEFGTVFGTEVQMRDEKPAAKQTADPAPGKNDADEKIGQELARISAMAPQYKSLADITGGSHGSEFADLVKRGMTFEQAFKLAYFDEIKAAAPEKTSKSHLKVTQSVGASFDDEPDDKTFELYREMMPDASDDDIRAMYSKTSQKYFRRR